jgi:hypothetical protein
VLSGISDRQLVGEGKHMSIWSILEHGIAYLKYFVDRPERARTWEDLQLTGASS